MLSIKLNVLFYDITKLQLDWTLDGDGMPLYVTGILQASAPRFTKLALPGTIVLHEQIRVESVYWSIATQVYADGSTWLKQHWSGLWL